MWLQLNNRLVIIQVDSFTKKSHSFIKEKKIFQMTKYTLKCKFCLLKAILKLYFILVSTHLIFCFYFYLWDQGQFKHFNLLSLIKKSLAQQGFLKPHLDFKQNSWWFPHSCSYNFSMLDLFLVYANICTMA